MNIEKKIIGENNIITTRTITLSREGRQPYTIIAFHSHYSQSITYTLCNKMPGFDTDFCYWEMLGFLQKEYHIASFPAYFEESDLSICSFDWGHADYELQCNYDVGIISLVTGKIAPSEHISDELAIMLVQHLLEVTAN
jgi:hypothetical protein